MMKSWCFLCRKHFDQEKKIVRFDMWCKADKLDKMDTCDYPNCTNMPYREVYSLK